MVVFLDMSYQVMDCVTLLKFFFFYLVECFIAGDSGCFFPHNMIYFISPSLQSKIKGLMIVQPQLPVEFDGLFLLCRVTANREA